MKRYFDLHVRLNSGMVYPKFGISTNFLFFEGKDLLKPCYVFANSLLSIDLLKFSKVSIGEISNFLDTGIKASETVVSLS